MGVCITSLIVFKAYIGNTIYKNAVLDYLELTYYFNIVLLTIATFYYARKTNMQSIAAAISISIALIMFLYTLIYHIILALRNTKMGKKLKARIDSCCEKIKFGRDRNSLLHINLPQGIEMNSIEVATPTSSVVSLSRQDETAEQELELESYEDYKENEQQFQCNVKTSDQLLLKNDVSQELGKSAAKAPYDYSYKENPLQEPLLKVDIH